MQPHIFTSGKLVAIMFLTLEESILKYFKIALKNMFVNINIPVSILAMCLMENTLFSCPSNNM